MEVDNKILSNSRGARGSNVDILFPGSHLQAEYSRLINGL